MDLYHVYFDGEPELIGHICAWHKRVGDGIQCSDMDADGNCPHVQVRPCDCARPAECVACLDERGIVA